MKYVLVILVVLVVAAVWTNPDEDDFSKYVQSQTRDKLLQETGDSDLGQAISDFGSSLAGSFTGRMTERNNYGLFSTYTIDLDGADKADEDWTFLGVAGRFYELNRPESIQLDHSEP